MSPRNIQIDAGLPISANASDTLRADLRRITWAWVFGSAWLWIVSGAVLTRFAQAVGTPAWGFGVLAAVPFVAALSQLPVSWWLNRHGGRRRLFLWCCATGRALFVAVAALPWVVPEAWGWWPIVVMMLLLAWALIQSTGPAWMNWMSDLIPRRVRGRYFARRAQVTTPLAVVVSLGAAALLDWADAQDSARLILQLTSMLLAVAGVLGTVDILIFLWIPDRHEEPPHPDAQAAGVKELLTPLRHRGFRHFLGYNFTFTLAMGFMGQYIWLYVLEKLSWTNLQANALIIAVPLLLNMLTQPMWGRLIDRLGKRPVLLISGSSVSVGALGWMVTTPEHWWLGYAWVMAVAATWPGVLLANFNFLLEFSKTSSRNRRGEQGVGSQAAALFSVGTAVAGGLSGVIGGAVAGQLGDWSWTLTLDNALLDTLAGGAWVWTLNYFHVLFAVSTLLRIAALGFALGLEEPAAKGTRDSMRYLATGVYNNMRQAVATPVRMAGPVSRWAYRLDKLRASKEPKR